MLAKANIVHIIWCVIILLILLVLAILHHRWKYYELEMKRWRKMCCIPLLITSVHYMVYVGGVPELLTIYTPMYLIAVLALLPVLCAESKKGYRVVASVTGTLSLIFGLHFCTSTANYHNFARKSYTDSFHALVKEMDRSYVLKEWKDIDFSALEEKYMPLVRKAEKEKDPAQFSDAVTMFCNELHDGHISVHTNYDTDKYSSVFELNDYGLALVKLDSGEVIAVCTEKSVNKLGIEDGTVITKWNGKDVLKAVEDIPDTGMSVKANADRLALLYLSATGGDTVDVTFIDKSGREKNATLSALEDEHTLGEVDSSFLHRANSRHEQFSSNYSTKMLDDKCGYLVLTAETTGSSLKDDFSFYKGESKWARELFRKKLRALKEQGMKYLVIDLRNNLGGFEGIGCELCSLLTNEGFDAAGLGVRKNGEYSCVLRHKIHGDGEFADLKVVALTNLYCISAGDATALNLSKLPNVTLAGITDPNGSGQITGGGCVLSDSIISVSYPVGLMVNTNNEPDIDTRADQLSRNSVEVRIPLDYDAAMAIFRDKKDYELEWAVKYLESES